MKGTFTRKDNGKVLKTTRAIVGEELVQVSYPLWKMFYTPLMKTSIKHIYTSEEENRQQTLVKVQIKCLKVPSLIYLRSFQCWDDSIGLIIQGKPNQVEHLTEVFVMDMGLNQVWL